MSSTRIKTHHPKISKHNLKFLLPVPTFLIYDIQSSIACKISVRSTAHAIRHRNVNFTALVQSQNSLVRFVVDRLRVSLGAGFSPECRHLTNIDAS